MEITKEDIEKIPASVLKLLLHTCKFYNQKTRSPISPRSHSEFIEEHKTIKWCEDRTKQEDQLGITADEAGERLTSLSEELNKAPQYVVKPIQHAKDWEPFVEATNKIAELSHALHSKLMQEIEQKKKEVIYKAVRSIDCSFDFDNKEDLNKIICIMEAGIEEGNETYYLKTGPKLWDKQRLVTFVRKENDFFNQDYTKLSYELQYY